MLGQRWSPQIKDRECDVQPGQGYNIRQGVETSTQELSPYTQLFYGVSNVGTARIPLHAPRFVLVPLPLPVQILTNYILRASRYQRNTDNITIKAGSSDIQQGMILQLWCWTHGHRSFVIGWWNSRFFNSRQQLNHLKKTLYHCVIHMHNICM